MGAIYFCVLHKVCMNIIVANYLVNRRKQKIRIAKQFAHR